MPNQYDLGDVVSIEGNFYNINNVPTDPSNIKCSIKSPTGTLTEYTYGHDDEVEKVSEGKFTCDVEVSEVGTYYYKWYGWGGIEATEEGYFFVKESYFTPQLDPTKEQDLTYLIPFLRLKIGDINSSSYRYTDGWLKTALVASVKELGRWWNFRYLVDLNNIVSRNSNVTFDFEAPPVIQTADEAPIVIMASLITLEGSLENNSWSVSSWRDNEISFSNLESGRLKDNNLNRLRDELYSIMTPPSKKLARAKKGSLPGFMNDFEMNTKY